MYSKKILGFVSLYIHKFLYLIIIYLIYYLDNITSYLLNYIENILTILLNKDLIILSYIILSIPLFLSTSLLDFISFKDNNTDSVDDIKLQIIKLHLKESVIQINITQKFLTPFMFVLYKFKNKS